MAATSGSTWSRGTDPGQPVPAEHGHHRQQPDDLLPGLLLTWTTAPAGTAVQVSLSVPFSQASWLAHPFFVSSGQSITASATFSKES